MIAVEGKLKALSEIIRLVLPNSSCENHSLYVFEKKRPHKVSKQPFDLADTGEKHLLVCVAESKMSSWFCSNCRMKCL